MREHTENAPLTIRIEGSTVPGRDGKHDVCFKRVFASNLSQTNIESLTTVELIELQREIERYIVSLLSGAKIEERIDAQHQFGYESHPEWDACRRNASERT
jgi:hypothetical protein